MSETNASQPTEVKRCPHERSECGPVKTFVVLAFVVLDAAIFLSSLMMTSQNL